MSGPIQSSLSLRRIVLVFISIIFPFLRDPPAYSISILHKSMMDKI